MILLPGKPEPLGATWDGRGVNFALFSGAADAVELCLFDAGGAETRLALRHRTGEVWHGYAPGLAPSQRYGYRVHGPWRPQDGQRFDAKKLLIDPYARALDGAVRWSAAWDQGDNAAAVPKSLVVADDFDWGDDRPPRVPWEETVLLELHVRGFTKQHPDLRPEERGTFGGLAAEPAIEHLRRSGVTAIELMPIHAFVDDRHLVERGLANYWGYNSVGFFAPEPRFLAAGDIAEVKRAVKRLHQAGIEVLLDVVYNHSGEGDHTGATICFRGIDNAAYYRLEDKDRRRYVDHTGTGNTLNLDHPRVLALVLDSLRYWVEAMHVDGFRFDLAPALARVGRDYSSDAPFFAAVARDPVLSAVKLIAEPWDAGPGGFQLGNFPAPWAEWNARYRDTVRRFWRGDGGQVADLASRIAGSSDIFARNGRPPSASINYVTCHDGFTLQDLVSYAAKHNEANGEGNRDGSDENESANYGVEGATDDSDILALRDRQKRNFLATVMLSLGVPMLLVGDDCGRSQGGNNNPYCQDGPVSWLAWTGLRHEDEALELFLRELVALRRRHPAFKTLRFLHGEVSPSGLKDIAWFTPGGDEADDEHWQNPGERCLGYLLGGVASLLVLLNAGDEAVQFRIPQLAAAPHWRAVIDTAAPGGLAQGLFSPGETFSLGAKSMAVLSATGDEHEIPA